MRQTLSETKKEGMEIRDEEFLGEPLHCAVPLLSEARADRTVLF